MKILYHMPELNQKKTTTESDDVIKYPLNTPFLLDKHTKV